MTVSRVCRRNVDLVDLNESAWAAAERMFQRNADTLMVIDELKRPLGVVSARDLVVKVIASERSPRTTRVRDIMTAPVPTIPEFSSAEWVLGEILSSGLMQLPVVDAEKRLVGTIVLEDVLAYLEMK